MGKYLIHADGAKASAVVDADSLERWIEMAVAAGNGDQDVAAGLVDLSPYLANRLAEVIERPELAPRT